MRWIDWHLSLRQGHGQQKSKINFRGPSSVNFLRSLHKQCCKVSGAATILFLSLMKFPILIKWQPERIIHWWFTEDFFPSNSCFHSACLSLLKTFSSLWEYLVQKQREAFSISTFSFANAPFSFQLGVLEVLFRLTKKETISIEISRSFFYENCWWLFTFLQGYQLAIVSWVIWFPVLRARRVSCVKWHGNISIRSL